MVRHPHLRGSAGGERPVRVVESSVAPGLQCSIAANTVLGLGGSPDASRSTPAPPPPNAGRPGWQRSSISSAVTPG
jgi:hypothetical protein